MSFSFINVIYELVLLCGIFKHLWFIIMMNVCMDGLEGDRSIKMCFLVLLVLISYEFKALYVERLGFDPYLYDNNSMRLNLKTESEVLFSRGD